MKRAHSLAHLSLHDASASHLSRRLGWAQLRKVHSVANRKRQDIKQFQRDIGDLCLDDEMGADVTQKHAGASRRDDPLKLGLPISADGTPADASAPALLEKHQRRNDCVWDGRQNGWVLVIFISDGGVNGPFAIKKASGVSFANHAKNITQSTTNQQEIEWR